MLAQTLVLAACSQPVPPPEISGELRVGTRNSPATYYVAHNGDPAGFEHDLIQAFSQSQNWSLSWVEQPHLKTLFEMLDSNQIDLVAATLPRAVVQDRHLIAGPVLFETPVHIVYRRGGKAPRSMADLRGKRLALITGSGHTAILMHQKRKHPDLAWEALENVWPEELLAQLQA
ncbi:MAG TPA: transporter substrate-binding domain-containing protein, partial [Anaerolineaceae bacterium]|nr:transporter substrate-binding domain-containing protein [Anaerolineaceae bacterium]